MKLVIGASLSEPHTSGTALQDSSVCWFVCLRPYTVNFKCAYKYFLKIGYCQRAASATIAEAAGVQARTAPYFLFVTLAADRPSTVGCSQTVQIMHAGFSEIAGFR